MYRQRKRRLNRSIAAENHSKPITKNALARELLSAVIDADSQRQRHWGEAMFNRDNVFGNKVDAVKDLRPSVAGTGNNPPPAAARAPQPEPPRPESPVKAAAARESEAKGSRLIVGPDIKLKGAEITDCDTLVVEGRVEAAMDSRVIQIAEQGVFNGKAGIDIAEIHGRFEGDLTARKQLVIHSTGKVTGKIRYGKLTIAEGGELSGDVDALNGADLIRRDRPAVAKPATGLA
jgi:cytoskeletal protein CcmA (bactofilin family)